MFLENISLHTIPPYTILGETAHFDWAELKKKVALHKFFDLFTIAGAF